MFWFAMKGKIPFLLASLMLIAACGTSSISSEVSTISSDTSISSSSSVEESSSSADSMTHLAEPSIVIHYQRTDQNYTNWNLWLWGFGYDGARYEFNGVDSFGTYAHYPLSLWEGSTVVGFIVRLSTPENDWAMKDTSDDRFFNLNEWEPNEFDEYHAYLKTNQANIFTDTIGTVYNGLGAAYFPNMSYLAVTATKAPYLIELLQDNVVVKTYDSVVINGRASALTYSITGVTIDFRKAYKVRVSFMADDPLPRYANVLMYKLFSDASFTNAYNYDGELGAIYSPASTTFKIWAPTSSEMKLRLYDNGTPTRVSPTLGDDTFVSHNMTIGDFGVWSVTISGDLDGKFYTYLVTNSSGVNEVVDPYTKAAGVNGARGMVIDFSDTNPTNWNLVNDTSTFASNTDSTPYELHVRDLTMDDTWTGTEANRGRYAGMWESGTTYTEGATTVSTGFDHIKELGVNTVHILPFFDHNNDEVANAFNWGYNPLNYNVIEGSYSSNPYDGKVRIREAKDMIKAYDSEGIKIVMDVVYNHLGDANGSNFNKLVPGYYFRYGPTGAFSNGSGVGNDTASERYMFRKFMVDSTTFWAEEYKLGGFRFDLMGLHDTTTMKAVRDSLVAIDPDIVMYGEAWNSSTSTYGTQIMANQTNLFSANMTKIGGFSDVIRDAVKGSVFTASEGGWVQAASPTTALRDKLKNTLRGKFSISTDPQRLVNYVSAHDNMTLYDKIFSTGVSVANAPKINLQSSAIITFAQGIPFYHAGDELMRQKLNADGSFNHNSYNAPDSVNSIKWDNKVLYNSSFNKFKEMVALRNEHAIFRNASGADITANYTDLTSFGGFTFTTSTLGYRLTKGVSVTDTFSEVIVLHNGNNAGITVNASGYSVAFSSYGVLTASASMNIPGNTTVVLYA